MNKEKEFQFPRTNFSHKNKMKQIKTRTTRIVQRITLTITIRTDPKSISKSQTKIITQISPPMKRIIWSRSREGKKISSEIKLKKMMRTYKITKKQIMKITIRLRKQMKIRPLPLLPPLLTTTHLSPMSPIIWVRNNFGWDKSWIELNKIRVY